MPWLAGVSDPGLVAGFRRKGAGIFLGDASRVELLRTFGMDNPSATERVVEVVHRDSPRVPIYVRARDPALERIVAQGLFRRCAWRCLKD